LTLKVRDLAEQFAPRLIEFRRDLHMHPELSWKEFRTTEKIKGILRELDIEVVETGLETGVVGLVRGAEDGPTIALRGDIDALPVEEQNDVPYKSRVPGVMHACGHDSHATSLLGAAMILASIREELRGNVKFLFQPAEEVNEGAKRMMEERVLENPSVDAIFGLHCHPDIPAGQVGVKEGPLMAAVDTVFIDVEGVGGHGAIPDRTVDPNVATAMIIMALQTVVSRNVSPLEPVVVTIGTIKAGTANNIIPDRVHMKGTVRSFAPEVWERLPGLLERVVTHTAKSMGAEAKLTYRRDLPAVLNEERMTAVARRAVVKVAGPDAPVVPTPSMDGEDFAIFQREVPGCFVWLGVGNEERGISSQWHNPTFDIDEGALPLGAATLAQCAIDAIHHFREGR